MGIVASIHTHTMIVYINTSERDAFSIALLKGEECVRTETIDSPRKSSELLLSAIEDMLTKEKKTIQDILGIAVVHGPGSFTALRIGVATANALAFGLQVPVQGVDKSSDFSTIARSLENQLDYTQSVVPAYGSEPNIGTQHRGHNEFFFKWKKTN